MTDSTQKPDQLILTIDDDDSIRLMLKDILSREGFTVLTAADGQTGLDMFLDHHPDLVLLDVMMPKMDGFACIEALRALPNTCLLPIVMLTGVDDVDSIHRCFDLGATDFIIKPINWPTLPYRLRHLMRTSEALNSLARSETALRNAQKIAHLGSWEWEVDSDLLTYSKETLNVLGVTAANFNGHQDLFKTIHPDDIQNLQQALELCSIGGFPFSQEIRLVHTDNTEHIAYIKGEPEMLHGRVTRVHGTVQDITERRQIEDQVHYLSHYDALTHLPNRSLFKEMLEQAISYSDRHEVFLVVFFVSIDRFKRINETLGSAIGDRVLQIFTERLILAVRNSDYVAVAKDFETGNTIDASSNVTVSRLGDSEFTVMLNYIQDTHESVKVANHIFKEMATPFEAEGNEIYLAINIGITVYPGDGEDVDTLIKNGEFTMNHVHEPRQNSCHFFNKALNSEIFRKHTMENRLRHAVERNELVLHYQPKINLQNNQVVGMEALVRWQHPELGLLPPFQFISIAEESGLIDSIGDWVLSTACGQLCSWQQKGMPQSLTMSVNVSAIQLRRKEFLQHIRKTLESNGLAAKCLKLELTESILMDDIADAIPMIRKICALGVQISIDQFGTGHSSLSHLKKLPISELKIDRSFVQGLPRNKDDKAITAAIIALSKSLSLEVVAEGIENEQQVAFLSQYACNTVQGFYYSKPLPSEEFDQFMQQQTMP
jgi:PAS domain S-box-containing protein